MDFSLCVITTSLHWPVFSLGLSTLTLGLGMDLVIISLSPGPCILRLDLGVITHNIGLGQISLGLYFGLALITQNLVLNCGVLLRITIDNY